MERFEVIGLLGVGATAQVYRVRHRALGTEHALKLLTAARPGLRSRLLQEGQVQARLRHENLVAVSDIIEHDGRAGLVMEYISGDSLASALKRHGRMGADAALALFLPILDAVEVAHSAGILHRDLKPANILLADTDGGVVPKVTDFGIAKVRTEGGKKGQTRVGLAMGTPGYMAPEQWADSSSVDARADIFSLGVVLYEMLTGKLPYSGSTSLNLLGATMSGTPAPLSALAPATPAQLVSAVEAAIQPDPADRFADVEAFRSALMVEEPPPLPQPRRNRRTRLLTWMAGLIGLVGLGGMAVAMAGGIVLMWLVGTYMEDTPVGNEPVSVGSFSIDRTEVSYAEYQKCQRIGDCTRLRRWDNSYAAVDLPRLPVVGVDWEQASAYCRWRGGRLPTEGEWEDAATRRRQAWPWGDSTLSCTRANYEGCTYGGPLPTDTLPDGESPAGVRHLIGNVWEWTATTETLQRIIPVRSTRQAVLRGGGWSTAESDLEAARYLAGTKRISPIYGFRCAY
ncbi:MAG: hypothetical protein ACI8RZ_004379 [Myxococcota bacterium]